MKTVKTIKAIRGYSIYITNTEEQMWTESFTRNTSLSPEIIGLLLGRAKPIIEDELCIVCGLPIEDGKEYRPENNISRPYQSADHMNYKGKYGYVHEKCYKEKSELQPTE